MLSRDSLLILRLERDRVPQACVTNAGVGASPKAGGTEKFRDERRGEWNHSARSGYGSVSLRAFIFVGAAVTAHNANRERAEGWKPPGDLNVHSVLSLARNFATPIATRPSS